MVILIYTMFIDVTMVMTNGSVMVILICTMSIDIAMVMTNVIMMSYNCDQEA